MKNAAFVLATILSRPNRGLFREKVFFVEKVQKVQKREFFLAPRKNAKTSFCLAFRNFLHFLYFSTLNLA